ncbi:hypothetical protein ADL26_16180 [Thermoactinomyces vulgaris]|jgi:Ca-activated chloride channel homolog|nr:hypothetical protein ADL26_16180 [Thermoactinomyces vulgaris]
MRNKLFLCLLIVGLLISGCSHSNSTQPTEKKQVNNESKDKETVKIPEELKGVPLPPAGKYSGEKYNWAKVKQELDKIPKNADGKTILNKFYELAAEDYTPYFKYFQEFDTSIIKVDKGPGGMKSLKLPEEKPVNIVILVDSSGSMAAKVSGGQKMELAKQAVESFAKQMPDGANVSLTVYGHKGSNNEKDKAVSCNSIEEVYPLGAYDESKFNNALNKFQPTGYTPLAGAMKLAKQKLANQSKAENIIYVVSDGIETCGGDPVQVAKELHTSNIKAVVNIIGFDIDDAGQKALEAAAQAGGGKYSSVNSKVDLEDYFAKERGRLYDAWSRWAGEHYDKASDVSNKKYKELEKKSVEMYKITERETIRFYHMEEYLEKERGFEFRLLYDHVDQKFRERANHIHDYNLYIANELQKKVLEEANKIQKEVLNKANEEQDKLY